MIKAVLFDGDDTLYTVKKFIEGIDMQVMGRISKKTGVSAEKLYAEWKKIVGGLIKNPSPKVRYRDYSYGALMKKQGIKNAEAEGKSEYAFFNSGLLSRIELMPGVKGVLEELGKKYKLALVTGDRKERVGKKLKKFGLSRCFNAVITSTDTGVMKPSTKYYELAAKKLNVRPEECIVVGNSLTDDIQPAGEFGIKTVMLNSSKGDYSITSHGELRGILEKLK